MEILLCLDANEQWTENSGIAKFTRNLRLKHINQEMQLKATHPNIADVQKSTSIDYCLYSDHLFPHIKYAASTAYELEIQGDHRGIIMDIDIQRLFNEKLAKTEIKGRKLVMSNPKVVEKYLADVETKFNQQNIFRRSSKLM